MSQPNYFKIFVFVVVGNFYTDYTVAPPFFELEKCYLHEIWREFNQESIGVLRPGLACLVQKLR